MEFETNDLHQWLELSKKCKFLSESQIKKLCHILTDILITEPTVKSVSTPICVCGDIHGQFYDLEKLFEEGGQIPDTNYLFLGDFVDRGYYSLETITRLLILKAIWPDKITLIRGNHETRQTTKIYGFYDECLTKYGNGEVWRRITQIFDLLPLAVVIDGEIFGVHGGLSPQANTIDLIRTIYRNCEVPTNGMYCDLLWSDPDEIEDWGMSPRGAGFLFGLKPTQRFLHKNALSLICRAHQLVNEGYKYMFNDKLVTIWSAPNYCYRCGNVASILNIKSPQECIPIVFSAVPESDRVVPKSTSLYFL